MKLCEELSIDPAESVYIGDSPTDGQAATAAGMVSIGVCWGSHPKSNITPRFTYTVDTVAELRTLLNKICMKETVQPCYA